MPTLHSSESFLTLPSITCHSSTLLRSYSTCSITKATPVHLSYANFFLHYVLGITDRTSSWYWNIVCSRLLTSMQSASPLSHILSISVGLLTSLELLAQLDGLPSLRQRCYVFLRHATLLEIVALSMVALELMVLAGCSCVLVWAFWLAVELDFLQLKPTAISQNNSVCVTSAHNKHLHGRSKHAALHVCFIQQVIHDGIISAKQCPTAVQICRYPIWGPMLCLEYLSNPSHIKFQATGSLAANDFHSALPTPVRLLKYSGFSSWSRWCLYLIILLVCYICCTIADTSLPSRF